MTANRLTLNSSETEFLLTGLKKQLVRPPTLLATSAVSLMNTSPFLTRSHLSSNPVITFRVSRRRREMYCGHARLCVCLSVCVFVSVRGRMPTLLHGPGCNLGEW